MGSGRGKTCGEDIKGIRRVDGYKVRDGREGGQLPLYRKLPMPRIYQIADLRPSSFAINLARSKLIYKNGEVVNLETLREKGYAPRENARRIENSCHMAS